jgi:hypothetical protein
MRCGFFLFSIYIVLFILNMPVKRKSQKKHPVKKHTVKKHHAKKRVSKSKKAQKGGKLNAFFKLMLDAKKKDLSEFKYNGNTYKQFTAKTGLKMYKKA